MILTSVNHSKHRRFSNEKLVGYYQELNKERIMMVAYL